MIDTVTDGLRCTDIPMLDLGAVLERNHSFGELIVHRVDEHPNEIAHKAAAEATQPEAITRVLWAVLVWTAVLGILLALFTPHRRLVLALAVVPVAYLLTTALLNQFTPRHSVATLPFVIALSVMLPASLLWIVRSRKAELPQ